MDEKIRTMLLVGDKAGLLRLLWQVTRDSAIGKTERRAFVKVIRTSLRGMGMLSLPFSINMKRVVMGLPYQG